MLSLLNRERRHFLKREYSQRFFNVLLIFILFAVFYYLILLSSNFFLINLEKEMVEKEQENISNSQLQKQFMEYENKSKHLEKEYNLFSVPKISVRELSTKINEKNNKGISINNILFAKENENLVKIEIRGIAVNRDSLVNYTEAFKTDINFSEVNIPISNFSKNNNISFSISMKFELNKKNEN